MQPEKIILLPTTHESLRSFHVQRDLLITFLGRKDSPRFLIPRPFPLEEVVLPDRARMALLDPRWPGAADHSYPAFPDGLWSGRDSLRLASQQVRRNRLTRIRGASCDRDHVGHGRMA